MNTKCLSNGYCNVCGLISGKAEGCDIFSTSPVCDADEGTPAIEDAYADWQWNKTASDPATHKFSKCVPCKKTGSNCNNYQNAF